MIDAIKKVKVLYTYNGKMFDLPYINKKIGIDLTKHCIHKDLMYECRRKNLMGGLKEIERKLGIERNLDIDGRAVIRLWYKYLRGDKHSLTTLLEYNKEDILNLKLLRQKLKI